MIAQQIIKCLVLVSLVFVASCNDNKVSKPEHYRSVQGQVVDFPSSKGEWIILNFWASWCTPCREEISELNSLQKQNNISVVGVNVENLTQPQIVELIQNYNISYPILAEDPHTKFKLKPYPGIPATYILTPEGKWLEPLYGKQTKDSILKYIS